MNSYPRIVLAQTLKCYLESSRLYATQFLNVLIRARQKGGEMTNKQYKSPLQTFSSSWDHISASAGDINATGRSAENWKSEECPEMDSWLLELLIKQARDESKAVSLCALIILDEACNVKVSILDIM